MKLLYAHKNTNNVQLTNIEAIAVIQSLSAIHVRVE